MSSRATFATLILLAFVAGGCGSAQQEDEILVFAASSLAGVAPELAAAHAARGGVTVRFNFGSTATLGRQIAAGAPADALLGVGMKSIGLAGERIALNRAFVGVASNSLVVVVPADSSAAPDGLESAESIAVGDWSAGVPVGVSAKAWLEHLGRWSALEPRLVPAIDARATLTAVASGSMDAGIVYATDAASSDCVRIIERPEELGIDLDVGIWFVWLEEPHDPVQDFSAFLGSAESRPIWERHGFGTP